MSKETQNKALLLLLTVEWGIYFLWLMISHHLPGGVQEKEEWLIFVRGWVTIPFLSLGVGYLFEKIRRRFFAENILYYPALIFTGCLYGVFAFWLLRVEHFHALGCHTWDCTAVLLDIQIPSFESGMYFYIPASRSLRTLLLVLFPIFQIFIIVLLFCIKKTRLFGQIQEKIRGVLLFAIPIVGGLGFLNFSAVRIENVTAHLTVFLLSFFCLFHNYVLNFVPGKRLRIGINVFILTLIVFAVFDPAFSVNRPHQNPLLGPVSELRLGKALLVDIETTYGILMIYWISLALNFFPFSFQGLALLTAVFTMIQYALVYCLLRYLLKSILLACLTLFLILVVNLFATIGGEIVACSVVGPIRFGLPLLLIFLAMIRYRSERFKRYVAFCEKITVAIASLWSFEMLVYTWAVYLGILCYEEYYRTQRVTETLKNILKRVFSVLPWVALVYGLFILDTYRRSGQGPDWNHYLNFVFLVTRGQWNAMAVAIWSPWFIELFVIWGSFMAIILPVVFGWEKVLKPEKCLVAGLTTLGVIQFTYYLGRSHPNNLFHISLPVICLAAFWMAELSRRKDTSLRKFVGSFIFCAYFSAMYLVFQLSPIMIDKLKTRVPFYRQLGLTLQDVKAKKPTNEKVKDAMMLIEKYAKEKTAIPIFIEPDDTLEVMILSGKTNVYSIQYAVQIGLTEDNKKRLLDFKPPIQSGDIIFISPDALDFQQFLIGELKKKFRFIVREKTPSGILAIELKSL